MDIRIYAGYSVPRRGKQVTIGPKDTGLDVQKKAMDAFGITSQDDPIGVFVVLKGTQEVLGNVLDAAAPPFVTLKTLEAEGIAFDVVTLPLVELAPAAPRSELIDDDDASEATPSQAEFHPSDISQLDRSTANKLADKLARRIAKLQAYVETRRAKLVPGDSVLERKLVRAKNEILTYGEQLVLIEEQLAELDMLGELESESEVQNGDDGSARLERIRKSAVKESSSESSRGGSRRKKSSRRRKERTVESEDDGSASESGQPTKITEENATECGMCGKVFGLDPIRPRWVYVPARKGIQRLTVCRSCEKAVLLVGKSHGGKKANRESLKVEQFTWMLDGFVGPVEPAVFDDLAVPKYLGSRSNVWSGCSLISPDAVVSRYKDTGALHVRHLHTPEASVYENSSPILSFLTESAYVLTYHENDTLQAIDIHRNKLAATVDCSSSFVGDTSARSRTMIANDRWVIVASKERVCVWPWRLILAGGEKPSEPMATPAAHTMPMTVAMGDNPRDDFCALEGHYLLLGSNQSFSVWDVLATTCVFRFSFRDQGSIAAFYQVKLAGDSVVTLESHGVRVWPVGARVADVKGANEWPCTMRMPPLIVPVETGAMFTAFYADTEWLVLGTSTGRVRIRPLRPVAKKAAALMGEVDAESAPIEYLNNDTWLKAAKKLVPDAKAIAKARNIHAGAGTSESSRSSRKLQRSTPSGGQTPDLLHKVNHLERHGDVIFCAQDNGLFTVWGVRTRLRDEPNLKYVCDGGIRLFDGANGTCMLGCTDQLVGVSDTDEDLVYLKVTVASWDSSGLRLDKLHVEPPIPEDIEDGWRVLVVYGADSDEVGPTGDRLLKLSWINKVLGLQLRAEAQRVFFLGVSDNAQERAIEQLPPSYKEARIVAAAVTENALRRLRAVPIQSTWHDPTLDAPEAQVSSMPGAEPFNPIACQVLVNVGGFVKCYALFVRYGMTTTPARIWAYVNKELLAPAIHEHRAFMSRLSKRSKRSGIGSLFKRK